MGKSKNTPRLSPGAWAHPFTAETWLRVPWTDANKAHKAQFRVAGCLGLRLHRKAGHGLAVSGYSLVYEHSFVKPTGRPGNAAITSAACLDHYGCRVDDANVLALKQAQTAFNFLLNIPTPRNEPRYGLEWDARLSELGRRLNTLLVYLSGKSLGLPGIRLLHSPMDRMIFFNTRPKAYGSVYRAYTGKPPGLWGNCGPV